MTHFFIHLLHFSFYDTKKHNKMLINAVNILVDIKCKILAQTSVLERWRFSQLPMSIVGPQYLFIWRSKTLFQMILQLTIAYLLTDDIL